MSIYIINGIFNTNDVKATGMARNTHHIASLSIGS
jgi:hypothetical protein